jgi:hypothetical protein
MSTCVIAAVDVEEIVGKQIAWLAFGRGEPQEMAGLELTAEQHARLDIVSDMPRLREERQRRRRVEARDRNERQERADFDYEQERALREDW